MTGLLIGMAGLTISSIIHSFTINRMHSRILDLQVRIAELESKARNNVNDNDNYIEKYISEYFK